MDNHLWAEALRAGLGLGPEGIRAEVAEEVLRSGSRYLQSGGCARLVTGALAGCIGIVLPECGHLSLRILRCPATRGGAEHVESVH